MASNPNLKRRKVQNRLPLALAVVVGGMALIATIVQYVPSRSVDPDQEASNQKIAAPAPTPKPPAPAPATSTDAPQPASPKQMMGRHPAIPGLHMTAVQRQFDTLFNKGVAHMQVGQYAQALDQFRQAEGLRPNISALHANMGFTFYELNRVHEARVAFERAINANKDQVNAYYGLALAFAKLGKHGIAVASMESYLHLTNGQDPFADKAFAHLRTWREAIDVQRRTANNADKKKREADARRSEASGKMQTE